jgi:hypothetical protein
MILHKHWLENELTHDELCMLMYIAQQNCEVSMDIDTLQCIRLNNLSKKIQQVESQVEEGSKEIYENLKKKLIDFVNLQIQ